MRRLSASYAIMALFLTGPVVGFFIPPGWAETTTPAKIKAEKEAKKKAEEAAQKALEEKEEEGRAQRLKEQIERLTQQQQFIREHNRRLQDAIARTQFATAVAVLEKDVYKVGEEISVDYVLKNRASKGFLIDGRKSFPSFTVKDASGNVILTPKKSEKKNPLKKEDLVRLGPGETFSPKKLPPFTLSKPGKYTLYGTYVFLRPEEEEQKEGEVEELDPDVWFGTVNTVIRKFEVVEKKKGS